MAERFNFSVAYESATLESAVRAYMWRVQMAGRGWIPTTAVSLFVVVVAFLIIWQEFGLTAGAIAAVVAALALVGVIWGMIVLRARDAKLAMMKEPRAVFVLSDDSIEMKTDRGAGKLPWNSIRQIWKFRKMWLLMMDRNRFLTLPLADAPAEALQFLEEKIQPRPFSAA